MPRPDHSPGLHADARLLVPVPQQHPERVRAARFGAINDLVFTSPFLVFVQGTAVTVIDASNPGAAPGSSSPNNSSITAGMPLWTVPVSSFGRPAGEQFLSVTALTDPDPTSLGKKVYILAAFQSATNAPTGFSLVKFDATTGGTTLVGQFTPPAPFSGPQAIGVQSVTLIPESTGDVTAFMWRRPRPRPIPEGKAPPLFDDRPELGPDAGVRRPRSRGVSVHQRRALVDPEDLADDRLPLRADGSQRLRDAARLRPPQSPATSGLRVFKGGTELPADGTATAFLGDTLSVQPTVAPSNAIMPISSWNVDWNFHAASEDAGAGVYPAEVSRLDRRRRSGGTVDLRRPVRSEAGGRRPDRQQLLNSVLNNGGFGGPDFTANPAPGSTKALSFALEACNSFTPCSNGPAVFTINWKVPTVRLRGSAIITGAAVQDGSDGQPLASGYKWYFGSNPAAPAGEALVQDTTGAGCNGSSSCAHAFPGPGTYNVWLTVPYANGYVTPDCAACTSVSNGLKVTVTDVVPAFLINNSTTAPTSAFLTQGSLRVDSQSQISTAATVTGYVYCLSPSVPRARRPSPSRRAWARFRFRRRELLALHRINFTKAGVSQPRADWTPAISGVSDPKAWPVNIQSQPPSLHLTPSRPVAASGARTSMPTSATRSRRLPGSGQPLTRTRPPA